MEFGQRRAGLRAVSGDDGKAMLCGGASGVRGVSDIRERLLRICEDVIPITRREVAQGLFAASAKGKQVRGAFDLGLWRGAGGGRGCFLEKDVSIGAAKAEGADSGDPFAFDRLERHVTIRDAHGKGMPRDERIRIVKVQVGRDLPLLKGQDDFEQARQAGSGLQCPRFVLIEPIQRG